MIKRRVEEWTVERLEKERPNILFPEYQREKSLWPVEKKVTLIDSILRDIDIPKLYFNRRKGSTIEVIDGQQRLWSIWEFLNEDFPYKFDGKSLIFSNLDKSQRDAIKNYKFQVTVFDDADEDYLRMLFIRLQLGFLLNTGEKLHALTGRMKRLIFDNLAKRPFVANVGIPGRRFAKETLCAQIAINSFSREKNQDFSRTRYEDLEAFFHEYSEPKGKDLELFQKKSRAIGDVLDHLWSCFGTKTQDLKNRSYILSIYLFIEEFGPLPEKDKKQFVDFIFKLSKRLKEEMKLGMDRHNRELYSFETALTSAPGEAYQITRRHEQPGQNYAFFLKKNKILGD